MALLPFRCPLSNKEIEARLVNLNTLDRTDLRLVCKDREKLFRLVKYYTTDICGTDQGYIHMSIFNDLFGWSIPSRESVEKIVDFIGEDKVLEIGGGRGLWSRLLQESGIDVICTSKSIHYSQRDPYRDRNNTSWTTVHKMKADEAIRKYSDRNVIFISWGMYSLDFLMKFRGRKVVIVGEGDSGCTSYLRDGQFGFQQVGEIEIPRWFLREDKIRLYQW